METVTPDHPPGGSAPVSRVWKIALAVVLGLVALCGLAGTCLFIVMLVLPGGGK